MQCCILARVPERTEAATRLLMLGEGTGTDVQSQAALKTRGKESKKEKTMPDRWAG